MLVFIIPLRSQKVSRSWDLVCRLFERTLRSVCQQTSPDFRVIVVCTERPAVAFQHPAVEYLEITATQVVLNPVRQIKELDQYRRIATGLLAAQAYQPTHTMVIDADDCVSPYLADHVKHHPEAPGWYLNSGYVYVENSRWIYLRRSAFNRWCGSAKLIHNRLHHLPDPAELEEQTFVQSQRYLYDHKSTVVGGESLAPLPMRGAVYSIGNGENIYQTGMQQVHHMNWHNPWFRCKDLLNYRPLTPALKQEFGLYPL
jgi:Putative rhamnosyl transferase